MSEKTSSYLKLGELRKSKKGNEYIQLGNENADSSKSKYNFEVQVMVKNAQGEKVALLKNPRLFFSDPRKPRQDGTVPNTPEFILENIGLSLESKE